MGLAGIFKIKWATESFCEHRNDDINGHQESTQAVDLEAAGREASESLLAFWYGATQKEEVVRALVASQSRQKKRRCFHDFIFNTYVHASPIAQECN